MRSTFFIAFSAFSSICYDDAILEFNHTRRLWSAIRGVFEINRFTHLFARFCAIFHEFTHEALHGTVLCLAEKRNNNMYFGGYGEKMAISRLQISEGNSLRIFSFDHKNLSKMNMEKKKSWEKK